MTTDSDRGRWEGDIEARVAMTERRLDNINGHIGDLAEAVNGLRTDLARFASKTGVYMGLAGAIAAAVTSGMVAIVVYIITKGGNR